MPTLAKQEPTLTAEVESGFDAIVGFETVTQHKSDSLHYNRLWIDHNQGVRRGGWQGIR